MKRIFIDILSGLWVRWKILLGWLAIWFEPISVGNGRGSTPLSSSNLINIHEGHMAKITLNPITGSYASVTSMNDRFQLIEDAFNDNVLWRLDVAGGTNNMQNLLDMNSQQIINLPAPSNNNNAARLQDILDASTANISSTTALLTTLSDSGSFYAANNAEAAFAELGATTGANIIGVLDSAGNFAGTDVETALSECTTPTKVQILSGKTLADPVITGDMTGSFTINGGSITDVGPSFQANMSATLNTTGILPFTVEIWDTNSDYDITAKRFTPTVSGLYHVGLSIEILVTGGGVLTVEIKKNGGIYSREQSTVVVSTTDSLSTDCLVSMNGTTDYLEAFITFGTATGSITASSFGSLFEANRVRDLP